MRSMMCRSCVTAAQRSSGSSWYAGADILVIDERIQNEAQRATFIGQSGMDLEPGWRRTGRGCFESR